MIIDFSIENYLSIREKVIFSMEASGSNKLSKGVINTKNKIRLVKSMAIYGANASGKSNLMKGLLFMWNMIVNSHKFNVGEKIPRIPFKLDEASAKKPSKFEINFIQKGVRYKYGFSCNEEEVIEEYLYYWPKGKKSLIFKRDKKNHFVFNTDETQQKRIEKQTILNTLYVSRATQLGFEKTKLVYEFFKKNLVIYISYSNLYERTVNSIYENQKLRNKIIEFLQRADFGGINDIIIKKAKGKVREIKFDVRGVSQRDLEDDILDIKFIHKVKNQDIPLDMMEESLGTQKTFAMLGLLFDILEKGKVAFIDEIDSSLHPKIAQFLVKLFSSRHNKRNAQLIFITHTPALLNNEMFRRDQFYFCEKEPNKSTKLTSLIDYDIRQDADFEKAYSQGRLGANPFIDETYVE